MRFTHGILFASFITSAFGVYAQNSISILDAQFPTENNSQLVRPTQISPFFQNEASTDSHRPIWILMGDSLSTGWATGRSLQDKSREFVIQDPNAPREFTFADYNDLLPEAEYSWFAGRQWDGGLWGHLERKSRNPWLVVPTAQTAGLLARDFRNQLESLEKLRSQAPRVKLITISMGTNDHCVGQDSVTPQTLENLKKLKAWFPNAAFVALESAPLNTLYQSLKQDIFESSTTSKALKSYCLSSIKKNCPALTSSLSIQNLETYRTRLTRSLKKSGFEVFDPFGDLLAALPKTGLTSVLADDCFHPSGESHQRILTSLAEWLDSRFPGLFTRSLP